MSKPWMDVTYPMRNIVLMSQAIIGTVNADRAAFQSAIADLGVFLERWPTQLKGMITRRQERGFDAGWGGGPDWRA